MGRSSGTVCAVRGCTHSRTKLNAWLRAEQSASSTNHKLNQTFFPRFLGDFFPHKPLFKTIMTILWNTQNGWITSPYASHSHTNGSSTHSFAQCTMGRRKKVDRAGKCGGHLGSTLKIPMHFSHRDFQKYLYQLL